MTVYNNLKDIPYSTLRQGGTFTVALSGMPSEMLSGTDKYGAMPYAEAASLGMLDVAVRDNYGDIITLNDVDGSLAKAYVENGGIIKPMVIPAWIIFLVKLIVIGIFFVLIISMVIKMINAIAVLFVVPEGRKIAEYTDGSYDYEAGDRSLWHVNADGTWELIQAAPKPAGDFGDVLEMAKLAMYAALLIGGAFFVFKFVIPEAKKLKPEAKKLTGAT